MFRWIQSGVTWILDLICGPSWTGGVKGAIPFAVVCLIILIAAFAGFETRKHASSTLEALSCGDLKPFAWSGMFISTMLFMVLFAALYYSRSRSWMFVFALITGATPKEFCPTAYNYADWPFRMKLILWAAVIFAIGSIIGCTREKKPLRAILEDLIFSSALIILLIIFFYIRELSDENGKSLGFDWLFLIPELIIWCILIPLPLWSLMGATYKEPDKSNSSGNTGSSTSSYSSKSNVLPNGSVVRDVTNNVSCTIRREGDFVHICRPDGTEDVVYASEFDGKTTISTSTANYIIN